MTKVNIKDIVIQFIIGGSTVALISYLGNFVNPVLAGIFASIPLGLPSGYYIASSKAPAYYKNLLIMTTGLLMATAITSILVIEYKVDKNTSIIAGMLTWAIYGAIYYFYQQK